jgi:hypothetical protein
MRELTLLLKFTSPSLGNVKDRVATDTERYLMPRSPSGKVAFPSSWHSANLRFAARLLNRHMMEVSQICWDVEVDAVLRVNRWHNRHYFNSTGRQRFVTHECFQPGQVIGLNCTVPASIDDGDFIHLMNLAGRYCGLSPARPKEYGHFVVESIRPRRGLAVEQNESITVQERVTEQEEAKVTVK